MAIAAGTLVEAVTAHGDTVRMRAIGNPTQGRDFPVVWVCTEEEFDSDGEVRGVPWPLDAVREVPEQGRPTSLS